MYLKPARFEVTASVENVAQLRTLCQPNANEWSNVIRVKSSKRITQIAAQGTQGTQINWSKPLGKHTNTHTHTQSAHPN